MPYRINQYCVCCHYCRMECPASAINFVGTKYEIDPEKCTECGLCEKLCPISAISNTSLPPEKPEKHELIELQSDLVVLGAGGSGLISAVRFAQLTGKKVIVLEKAKKPGGNTNLAHGFMVFNSKWQQDAGIPDFRDDFIRDAMKRVLHKLDNKIIENAVYATGPFFDWLCELGGAEEAFQLGLGAMDKKMIGYPYRKFANLKCRDQAIGPGWAGTYVIRKMLEYCDKLGIKVLTEHKAVKLYRNEQGAISGVLAEDPGGQTKISCSAVVVSTGGFGRGDEKLKKYFPEFFAGETPIHRFSVPTNTGDGMDLGEEIGADIAEKNLCVNMFGPAHHPFGYCGYRIMMQPEVLYINLNGKRWIDESAGLMDSRYRIAEQPKEISYAVVDSNILEIAAQRLIANPPDGTDDWILRDYRQEMEEELKLDTPLKKGDTLEELALQMGIDPAAFVEEIKRYNTFCANGRDDDFLKHPKHLVPVEKPPFYAFYGKRFSEGAFGGLKINEKMQVLDKQGRVIPGLYATGDAASANLLRDTLGVISELTWCVSSGYMAGGNLADSFKK
ncbi:MAG: FAD-binding protein [Oscillospiraceae bacterium]|jgi:fumarate reductase flavoprotein subunit